MCVVTKRHFETKSEAGRDAGKRNANRKNTLLYKVEECPYCIGYRVRTTELFTEEEIEAYRLEEEIKDEKQFARWEKQERSDLYHGK